MRQQTTLADLNRIIGKINDDRGLGTNPDYKVIGSVRLGQAYGGYRLEEIANDAGAIHDLTGYGTKSETYDQAIRLRFSKPISR